MLIQHGKMKADFNMAFDEAMLLRVNEVGMPILRFYAWNEPAATFGYFQKYSEIKQTTPLRPLIRRPTGGGLVPHENDWTYSLTFPVGHDWYRLKAEESYQRVHEWVADALTRAGMPSELSPCCIKEGPGQCFLGAEKYDVLHNGAKIAGAAQRRNKQGLLIQGSIQPGSSSITREAWTQAMKGKPPTGMTANEDWENKLKEEAETLVAEKYERETYNQKR